MSSDLSTTKVRDARDQYLVKSGYSVESYDAPRFKIAIGKFNLNFRNPGKVHYHDLHHVVSGYTTGLVGEGEVSAYELRGGSHSFMITFFCIGAIAIALMISPRRVAKAWSRAKGTSTLYKSQTPYDELLDMSVEDLRSMVNVPVEGFV